MRTTMWLAAAVFAMPAAAWAQIEEEEEPTVVIVEEDDDFDDDRQGLSLTAGGGVFGYSDEDARDLTTDVGLSYSARLHVGTRSPLGFEAAYVGTAQDLEVAGVDDDALLISNGVDGAVRLNVLTGAFQPYVLGGAAWKRYTVERTDVEGTTVRSRDDVLELPVGGGLAFYVDNIVVDARSTYRFTLDDDIVRGPDEVDLDNWDVTLRAGIEF